MYPLQRALPRLGHRRGSVVPLDPCSESFLQALVRDDFVWIQLSERHTSKQKAEQWIFSGGSMGAWSHGWDLWTGPGQIPHVVREPSRAHTLHRCLIYLSHCIAYTKPEQPNTVDLPGRLRSGAGAGNFKNKTFITTCFSAAHILTEAQRPHFH